MKTLKTAALAVTILATSLPSHALAEQSPAGLVKAYIDVVVNGRDFDRIDEFVSEDLIQRNPNLPNGRAPLKAFWTDFMTSQPDASFTVARMISEGNLVVKHSLFQSTPDDRGTAVVDIFRIENGLIVEHWDVIQPVAETWASGNHPVLPE